jgi:hypothetical protein
LNGAFHLEMTHGETMIKLRIDVDYAYPSRGKSFLSTGLKHKIGKGYLKNSKIIAKMINETQKEVKAYWFFTPYTMPDRELLGLLHSERHEVALHVASNPYAELERLEKTTGRKVNYYTVHGTARLFARLMWRRKLWEEKAPIPKGFPLKSFYDFPTIDLDWECYSKPTAQAVKIAENNIAKGKVLHVHPEWLFQRGWGFLPGKIENPRGPFYETLKNILEVDEELETLVARKKAFARISRYRKEYEKDVIPTGKFIEKLADRGIDIFTFIERKWCCTIPNPVNNWVKTEDNIALLQVTTYDEWWEKIGKKTRNVVRKAEKSGVKTEVVEPSEKLAEGIWKLAADCYSRRAFSAELHVHRRIPSGRACGVYRA